MPFTVTIDPSTTQKQACVIPDATPRNAGVMTAAQAEKLAALPAFFPIGTGGAWYGLAPQAENPSSAAAAAGFTSYIWLKEDGVLHLVVEEQDVAVVTLLSNGFLRAPLMLSGTVYNTISNPKPAPTSLLAGQFIRETVSDNPQEHLFICLRNDGGTYSWKEFTFA